MECTKKAEQIPFQQLGLLFLCVIMNYDSVELLVGSQDVRDFYRYVINIGLGTTAGALPSSVYSSQ